ncbi:MAG: hypothetical protein IT200_04310 [Thermoleophilia bacterium]|nr:hypothetical protein [Thermoleophilia bacterium]
MRGPLVALGFGAMLTAGIAMVAALVVLALLVAPALVALAWNVLDLGAAIGLGTLGFWGCVLLGWFLAAPMAIRLIMVLIVFIADPAWLDDAARVHWPEPTLRNLLAIVILLVVASMSHGSSGGRDRRPRREAAPGA